MAGLLEPEAQPQTLPEYAELHCLSDFSFLRGVSSAQALFERAQQCGYQALAITDECSLSGIVRAWEASQATGVRLITGAQFALQCGLRFVLLVRDAQGYARLCALITQGRRAGTKGSYLLHRADVEKLFEGQPDSGVFALWLPSLQALPTEGTWLRKVFGPDAYIAIELHRDRDDHARLVQLLGVSVRLGLTAVACGDVHMALRSDRALQDVVTAIRVGQSLDECGAHLFRNGERHLRSRRALGNIYPPKLLQATVDLAARCVFDLKRDIRYAYPRELVPEGETATSHLRRLTEAGMRRRWPEGVPTAVRDTIEAELALIAELAYEPFFLTVADIVRFAESRGILCQGRGSSANSAVCYALGITAVNPVETRLLMARFLSKARDEPPDIDVDFEHERREEVLQYIYNKYGRDRAALAATVICYRGRSAVRDVARAFGLPEEQCSRLSGCHGWGRTDTPMDDRLREAGFDPGSPLIQRIVRMTAALKGHPRHLSQHVGGFVISEASLSTVVPVENAAMADRTIIQWDKDDLNTMGLLKVDCLALGMLTCIRKAFDLCARHRGRSLSLATIPREDPQTYAMAQRADTIGVFQIESRAQMSMLPRLKPATFYDLVVQVAIVRPGPIQGGMVHPYLRRRMGREVPTYPSKGVEAILKQTLGVPLFQEQVMELVMHAGYSPCEADNLRRSMAAWRRGGDMEPHRLRIRDLMRAQGYDDVFIEQIFEQIKGFGSYGFPQSHAASFAKLVYASCWLKRHEPAAFACALLNAQPMGFYSPSQIIQDARRGSPERAPVQVLPVDVQFSEVDYSLVDDADGQGEDSAQPAIRVGLRAIIGLSMAQAEAIVAARAQGPFRHVEDLCRRSGLDARGRELLAEAGALRSLVRHRNEARWAMWGIEKATPLLDHSPAETEVRLVAPDGVDETLADYRSMGLTLAKHPMALLRRVLDKQRVLSSQAVQQRAHGGYVRVAGLVTMRQRPVTANGTTFVTLEDEFGLVNIVVWPAHAARQRRELLASNLMVVYGRWEKVDGVCHVIAGQLHDQSELLGRLRVASRDFH
ncbi:error-prone DNA polymerase [Lysobacter soyae]|uniref:Error-prone DNA polymerase n=1 Tax=Lysobacter soyae TaxID=2764185 RepID=A0ABX8WNG6_9GAMM|nr:error-prone DNA polymerase [Lysobacter sp. CJ11]QYR52383.1 error-prone DNA polymerase [Lysobacter sp. CJ11]